MAQDQAKLLGIMSRLGIKLEVGSDSAHSGNATPSKSYSKYDTIQRNVEDDEYETEPEQMYYNEKYNRLQMYGVDKYDQKLGRRDDHLDTRSSYYRYAYGQIDVQDADYDPDEYNPRNYDKVSPPRLDDFEYVEKDGPYETIYTKHNQLEDLDLEFEAAQRSYAKLSYEQMLPDDSYEQYPDENDPISNPTSDLKRALDRKSVKTVLEDQLHVKQEKTDDIADLDESNKKEEFAFQSISTYYPDEDFENDMKDDDKLPTNYMEDEDIKFDISALPLPLDFCNEVKSTNEAMKKKIKTETKIKVEIEPEKDLDLDNLPLDLELKDMEGQFTSEVDGYKCKYCPFITIKPKYLQRHLREKHHENLSIRAKPGDILESIKDEYDMEGEKFKCKACPYVTSKPKYIKRHVRERCATKEEALEEEQTCTSCPYTTKKPRLLKMHFKENHTNMPKLPCTTTGKDGNPCKYSTKRISRLKRHIREVHEGVPRKRYPSEKKRPIEKPHICTMCTGTPYATQYRSGLQAHIDEVHLKLQAAKCPHCDHKCSRKTIMRNHIKYVHLKCEDFKCPDCGYLFSSKLKLATHKKAVHEKIRDQICDHCGAGFSAPGNLREHVKVIHFQIREYRCDECGTEHSTRSNLRAHLIQLSHTSKLDKVDYGGNVLALAAQNSETTQPQQLVTNISQQNVQLETDKVIVDHVTVKTEQGINKINQPYKNNGNININDQSSPQTPKQIIANSSQVSSINGSMDNNMSFIPNPHIPQQNNQSYIQPQQIITDSKQITMQPQPPMNTINNLTTNNNSNINYNSNYLANTHFPPQNIIKVENTSYNNPINFYNMNGRTNPHVPQQPMNNWNQINNNADMNNNSIMNSKIGQISNNSFINNVNSANYYSNINNNFYQQYPTTFTAK